MLTSLDGLKEAVNTFFFPRFQVKLDLNGLIHLLWLSLFQPPRMKHMIFRGQRSSQSTTKVNKVIVKLKDTPIPFVEQFKSFVPFNVPATGS